MTHCPTMRTINRLNRLCYFGDRSDVAGLFSTIWGHCFLSIRSPLRPRCGHSSLKKPRSAMRTKRSSELDSPMVALQNLYSKTAGSKGEWHSSVYKSTSSLDCWQYLTQLVFHQRMLHLCLLLANLIRRYGGYKTLNHRQTLIKFTAKISQFTDGVLPRRSVERRN